ncbi:MAG: hypothetical protein ACE5HU_08400, partial [Acidobacteriota bacterium]
MRRSIFLILPTCLVLASCSGGAERATAGDATSGSRAEAAATQPTAHPTGSAGERVSFGDISFEVPPAWEPRRPSSRMRVAQYAIPAAGADSGEVECGLFHFPGQGGTV